MVSSRASRSAVAALLVALAQAVPGALAQSHVGSLTEAPSRGASEPAASGAGEHPAATYITRGMMEMRTNPEASRRDAEAALEILRRQEDPDLEIRARMLLCDYYSERDTAAARAQIAAAMPLLASARRPGLRAGLLTCEGEIYEAGGENAQARSHYEHAVAVATDTRDDEMLAGALFSRGYLLGLQGDFATGLADLRRSQSLYEQLKMPHHALTALNAIAILYNRMGDYEQAEYMYRRALDAQ